MVKIGAIIQVRLGSERLPNKALLPLPFGGGPALLEHVVSRVRAASSLQEIVIATTNNSVDDVIQGFCSSNSVSCFRGAGDDVLDRFKRAAELYRLNVIVRLTGDNPFFMSETIDQAVEKHLQKNADYTVTEGLPLGTNIEVISFPALKKAALEATEVSDREHVTPFIRREQGFSRLSIKHTSSINSLRLTVDYPSDYALASMLYEKLYREEHCFGHDAIAFLLQQHPWLNAVNIANTQRKAFSSEKEELEEARKLLQTGGFTRILHKLQ